MRRVFPSFPMSLPRTLCICPLLSPMNSFRSTTSRYSSSSKSLMALSGLNPLPTAFTTSMSCRALSGSSSSTSSWRTISPSSVLMSILMPEMSWRGFLISPFFPMSVPTLSAGILMDLIPLPPRRRPRRPPCRRSGARRVRPRSPRSGCGRSLPLRPQAL